MRSRYTRRRRVRRSAGSSGCKHVASCPAAMSASIGSFDAVSPAGASGRAAGLSAHRSATSPVAIGPRAGNRTSKAAVKRECKCKSDALGSGKSRDRPPRIAPHRSRGNAPLGRATRGAHAVDWSANSSTSGGVENKLSLSGASLPAVPGPATHEGGLLFLRTTPPRGGSDDEIAPIRDQYRDRVVPFSRPDALTRPSGTLSRGERVLIGPVDDCSCRRWASCCWELTGLPGRPTSRRRPTLPLPGWMARSCRRRRMSRSRWSPACGWSWWPRNRSSSARWRWRSTSAAGCSSSRIAGIPRVRARASPRSAGSRGSRTPTATGGWTSGRSSPKGSPSRTASCPGRGG